MLPDYAICQKQPRFSEQGDFLIYHACSKRKRAPMALHPATQFLNTSQTIRLPVFSVELAFIKTVEESWLR
jgi:hypothetical protein